MEADCNDAGIGKRNDVLCGVDTGKRDLKGEVGVRKLLKRLHPDWAKRDVSLEVRLALVSDYLESLLEGSIVLRMVP